MRNPEDFIEALVEINHKQYDEIVQLRKVIADLTSELIDLRSDYEELKGNYEHKN